MAKQLDFKLDLRYGLLRSEQISRVLKLFINVKCRQLILKTTDIEKSILCSPVGDLVANLSDFC